MKSLLFIFEERIKQEKEAKKKLEFFVQLALNFFEENQDFFRIFFYQVNETLFEMRF